MEGLGERLNQLRRKNELTRIELAKQLNTNSQVIKEWENGVYRPTIEKLKEISNIYDVSLEKLIPNRKLKSRKSNPILKDAEGGWGVLYLKNVKSQPFFPESVIKNVRIIEIKLGIMKVQLYNKEQSQHLIAVDDILGFLEEMN